MLRGVVAEGSGIEAQIPGYVVAGQDRHRGEAGSRSSAGTRRPSTSRRSSGFAPASNPRFVVLVTVDEPKGVIWGGTIAAPAFRDIAQFALQYLEVPPDRPGEVATQ